MKLSWPGKSSLKSRLVKLLLGCDTLLLLCLTLSFVCYHSLALPPAAGQSRLLLFTSLQLTLSLLGVMGLAALLSQRIDWTISEPIRDLSRKMEIVSRSQDYRVRVERTGEDELAVLFACFNNMLAEISVRDERLALHSEELELEVAERTLELSEVNRQLEASLESVREAMQSAQSANRAKSDFLAQMSHEIRTPMYGVLGMTELLLGTDLTKEQARYVDTVRRSGEALLSIINNILDFSKIEAGHMELEQIPFDLHQLASDAIAICAEDAARKGLELTLELEPGLPRMFLGDPGRLRQVVVNLLGNAVKFTMKGSVRLSLTVAAPPALVRFSVEDTGIGIAPDAQQRIFNQFTQGDESMTRKYGGTGLGLAIARQLTELMGGALELESEPGRGSRFSFTAVLQPHEELPRPERCCTALRGKRVLLATDDERTRGGIEGELSSWGVDLECVGDAPEAFCRIVTAPFDLALLDHHLAGTDGIELAATIRTAPAGRSVRIMLLTEREEESGDPRLTETDATSFPRCQLGQEGLYHALVAALGMDDEERLATGCCGGPPPRPRQVLLVEDNVVNQEVGRGMLESLGCRVKVVEDGAAAVSEVQRSSYDIVFMDCQMPVLDGLEATRRIRAWEQGSDNRVPIIALTAYAMPGDRVACLEAGADDYLSKPFTCDEIAKAMDRQLQGAVTVLAEGEGGSPKPLEVISHDKMSGALEMIRTLPGNRGVEILRKVVELYLSSTPALLQTMREAESGGDAEKLKAAAHSFKSSSANLGALRLAGVCMELESLGRAGSTEGALPLLHQVEEEYRLVRDALRGGPLC
ncbi:response regulator [Geomonas subterranea]|uniref:histidine kinase n=1 Tax=Geomonas subterranea TaxID=2847989 RepID=A0ABX8LIZ6_9BACT|nr:response regulator [Geomonas subterranea]QXE91444.1 response regulator [Geomonas subterranea]QXM10468.1 response regulator [Geomonas subterranea]